MGIEILVNFQSKKKKEEELGAISTVIISAYRKFQQNYQCRL